MAKNDQAALGFGFYTGSQTKDLTLIPAEYVKLPEITLDQTTLTLSYNDTETHYIPVTLKNAETQDVSVAIYDGTEGTEQPDWITTGDYNGSEKSPRSRSHRKYGRNTSYSTHRSYRHYFTGYSPSDADC